MGPEGVRLANILVSRPSQIQGTELHYLGSATCPVNGVRLRGGFFGQTGDDEVHLITYTALISSLGFSTELSGTQATGPSGASPTNVGNGFNITAIFDIRESTAQKSIQPV